MKMRILFQLVVFVLFSGSLLSQVEDNPFELPNLPDGSVEAPTINIDSSNPFEISTTTSARKIAQEASVNETNDATKESASSLEVGMAIFVMVFLAVLLSLFRGLFQNMLDSALKDRKFNQVYRRMQGIWRVPNILFYMYFTINAAIFLFYCANYFEFMNQLATLYRILVIAGLVLAYFFAKHIIVEFIGRTFDIENETDRYSLLVLLFNIIIGVILTPLNIMILLGPDSFQGIIIICGIVILLLVFVLFLLRGLSIANAFLPRNTFHFFMYLCTIEIAPLFIIAKMMM
ncbi:MAG: DUF4271 domain-containing protein [Bacteroidia bacterium]|nr:DUF4271 domain-containing protein [Bacteroidia bacterium]